MRRMNSLSKAALWWIGGLLIFTSEVSGQTWLQMTPTGGPPTPRGSFGSAVFDPATDRMMVFGGGTSSGNTNEVWVLTSADGLWGTPQWIKLSPAGDPSYGLPAPRKNHSAVYDPSSNRMIVFDGCSASCGSFLEDVWVLTNADGIGGTPAWIELFPSGGPLGGRSGQAAVYDPGTNSMIIFGGDSSTSGNPPTYSDVWVLSNANGLGGTPTWTELSPTGGPPAGQAYDGAVYDPINNRMIVFGGYSQASVYSNATWALSNANGQGGTPVWTNLTAEGASGSPPATQGSTAVYDVASNRMTVFGGYDPSGTFYNNVWLLTDANGLEGTPTWMQLTPSGGPPAARAFFGAVFNPASARMTIFGGGSPTNNLNDTWVLTNANGMPPLTPAEVWTHATPNGGPPVPRAEFVSVLDVANDRMIVFGGITTSPTPPSAWNTNDVWVLTNADGLGGTPQWVQLSPTPDPTNGTPYPRHWNSMVYDSSSNRITVFGGCLANCTQASPPSPANDVWVLTNANGLGGTPAWIELFPTGGPPAPRDSHTAVYDPGTNSMIVFGGNNGTTATPPTFSDVWVLSNANGLGGTPAWTELSPTGGPPAGQTGHSAVYDSANNRMVVFGGEENDSSVQSNAVWVLTNANGQGEATPAWVNIAAEGATGSPEARRYHTGVYDASANRMTMFGGIDAAGTYYNDTWLLTNANGLGGTPTWMQLTPTGGPPAARAGHGAVFNPASARMTVFAGGSSTGNLNDTWVLSNANAVTGPVVGLSATSLTFASQVVGTTSSPQTVTLFSPGNAVLTISNIAASGDFAQTNTCDATLAAESSCTISVTFEPTQNGSRTGTVTITDDASGSPQQISLAGTGSGPIVSLPAPPTFPSEPVGTTSPSQTVTLTNTGNANLTFTAIGVSGPFAIAASGTTCSTSSPVAASGSCTVSLTFTPTAVGTNSGSLSFADNAGNSPQTVTLTGTGTGPVVSLPAPPTFPSEPVGTTSSSQTVTVTNTGNANLTFTAIGTTGPFAIAAPGTTCSTSSPVAASGSCTVAVTFTPTAVGTNSGSLSFADNAGNSPQTVALTGTGTGPVVSLSAPPTFPSEPVGTTSPPQTLTVTNTGNASLTFTAIGTTGPFAIATSGTTCSTSSPVAASGSCTLAITFTPTAGGSASGTISFTDNAGGSPQTLALSATGQDFSLAVPTGSSSSATVSPGGTATYTITATGIGGFNQAVSLSCSGAPSQASCQLSPSPVTPSSSGTNITVTVPTTAPSFSAPRSRRVPPTRPFTPWPGSLATLALLLAGVAWGVRNWGHPGLSRLRTALVALALVMLLALAMAACGGGGSSAPSNPGTPPGTYTITVTGSFGSGSSPLTHSVKLTLTVS